MTPTPSATADDHHGIHDAIPVSFVALMAVLIALTAFSIDTLIPAMSDIARSYQMTNPNDAQLLISAVLLGLAVGQLLFGAISDAFGRKKAIYLGISLYIIACLAAMVAPSYELLIACRFVQGFGASANRVAPIAIVRDQYKGPAMARIMSLVMSIFILIPAIAPLFGQAVLQFAPWPAIFAAMAVMSVLGLIWLHFGQEETLRPENRSPFSFTSFKNAAIETIKHPIARGYTIASGFLFGALISYLNGAQQLLEFQYKLGPNFVFAFGGMALAVGVASFGNAKLVEHFGLKKIVFNASIVFLVASIGLAVSAFAFGGQPPLVLLLALLTISFMSFGIMFGNYNAMAIAPLGHIAGVASSVTSFFQSFISVILGGFIAYMYDGTVIPLGIGFAVLALLNFVQMYRLDGKPQEA